MSVDLSDLSHSYPFLHLSRKLGVDYLVVLAIADSVDKGTDGNKPWYGGRIWQIIMLVCSARWRWQFPPEGKGL